METEYLDIMNYPTEVLDAIGLGKKKNVTVQTKQPEVAETKDGTKSGDNKPTESKNENEEKTASKAKPSGIKSKDKSSKGSVKEKDKKDSLSDKHTQKHTTDSLGRPSLFDSDTRGKKHKRHNNSTKGRAAESVKATLTKAVTKKSKGIVRYKEKPKTRKNGRPLKRPDEKAQKKKQESITEYDPLHIASLLPLLAGDVVSEDPVPSNSSTGILQHAVLPSPHTSTGNEPAPSGSPEFPSPPFWSDAISTFLSIAVLFLWADIEIRIAAFRWWPHYGSLDIVLFTLAVGCCAWPGHGSPLASQICSGARRISSTVHH